MALAAQDLGAGTKIGSLLLILRKEKEIEKLRLGGCPRTWNTNSEKKKKSEPEIGKKKSELRLGGFFKN